MPGGSGVQHLPTPSAGILSHCFAGGGAAGAAMPSDDGISSNESWELLMDLPPDILVNQVLSPFLSPGDKAALRQASNMCRRLANAAVTSCLLDAYGDTSGAHQQVPASFTNLRHLRIVSTPAAPATTSNTSTCGKIANSSSGIVSSGSTITPSAAATTTGCNNNNNSNSNNIQALQEQLPLLLRKLPNLSSLAYEGPQDRRQAALDMTPALQQLVVVVGAAAAAAAVPSTPASATSAAAAAAAAAASQTEQKSFEPASPATAAAATDSKDHPNQQHHQQQPQQEEQEQQLVAPPAGQPGGSSRRSSRRGTAGGGRVGGLGVGGRVGVGGGLRVLELRSGALPDTMMDVVGRLTSLVCLKLSSTTAINMFPVSNLTSLTTLHMTVTPPLSSALSPLSRLPRLSELQLAALSPARGWGRALAVLAGCPLQHLVLTFADVGDEDMQHLAAALTRLTYLNLNYSRHLSPACVPHLASLPHLQALHLEETGLTVRQQELLTLGAGCPRLSTMEACFELSALLPPPPPELTEFVATHQQGQQFHHLGSPQQQQQHNINNHIIRGTAAPAPRPPAAPAVRREGWPPLTKLILSGVSVGDFNKLLGGLPGLTSLVLSNVGSNANRLLADLVQRHTLPLQELCLSRCSHLDTIVCDGLAEQLPHLTTLSLTGVMTTCFAAAQWLSLLSKNAVLQSLTVCRCGWVDEIALQKGVGTLTSLRELTLSGCERVTGAALLSIAGRLPYLTRLEVIDCPGVEPGTRRAWEQAAAAAAAAAGAAAARKEEDCIDDAAIINNNGTTNVTCGTMQHWGQQAAAAAASEQLEVISSTGLLLS